MFDDIQLTQGMIPLLAGVIIQFLKVFPLTANFIKGKENEWLPVLTIAVSIGLAFLTKVPNPVVSGLILGLATGKGYDMLKAKEPKPK